MNGKGDSPRNCYSKQFKNNYDQIEWRSNEIKTQRQSSVPSCSARFKATDRYSDRDSKNRKRKDICRKE